MTYNYLFSVEIEFTVENTNILGDVFNLLGPEITDYVVLKEDATPNSEQIFEINMPPMILNEFAIEKYKLIENKLTNIGAKINSKCGLHVHVSSRQLSYTVDPVSFNHLSWDKFSTNKAEVLTMLDYTNQMSLLALKDIGIRYYDHFAEICTTLAPSRHNNYYAKKMSNYYDRIMNANTIDELARIQGGNKFYAVNYNPLRSSKETIEFRQRDGSFIAEKIIDWCTFLLNMIDHTIKNRIALGSGTTEQTIVLTRPSDTGVMQFGNSQATRMASFIIRNGGSASTREIMQEVGLNTPNSVRARANEIRRILGSQQACTNIPQQEFNNQYGSSNGLYDLGGYRIPETYTKIETTNQPNEQFLPPNIIGSAHVHYGLDHDVYNRLINRFS
tara:strand:+ start:583 stop:1746 length:1164 start_codon:yes stop_codon:yes gene_type:complete